MYKHSSHNDSPLTDTSNRFVNPRTFISGDAVQGEWRRHVERWHNCVKCPIGRDASTHVLMRGQFPCHVLFVGEAPGPSEDVIGVPFVGPAGNYLNTMLEEASEWWVRQKIVRPKKRGQISYRHPFTYGITNIIACYPSDPHGSFRQPTREEVANCADRLTEMVRLASPQLVVLLGRVAETHFPVGDKSQQTYAVRHISHPSYWRRNGVANQTNPAYRDALELLKSALNECVVTWN